ncbi:MAG: cation-translocating P-type ATPase, partial [Clostridia bacterium]
GFFDWHTISGGSGALLALYYFNPAWIAVILCGIPVFMSAARSLKNKKLTASVLISIAMLASIALEIASFFVSLGDAHSHSYVFAAGEIAALMELGELLEDLTVKKCRSGIQRLVGLIPTEANVITADGTVRLNLSKVEIGDHVLIKAGEMVPVDGVVVSGSASIDQSSLTGEFVPIDVTANDSVFGGTMSKSGVVEVEVLKLQKDMTIAKMAELTIEAEGKKAPISRFADKWAGIIVPMVFATSIIVGLICGLGTDIGTIPSIIRAITVLVVFCPCSLVLATPTAIAAGLGNSAKHGVLIKSGESLEELSRVDTVCFDKTGTITEGKIELSDVVAVGIDREELLRLSASVEQYSSHPLAVAVLQSAENHKLYSAENVKTINGVGISAYCNGQEVAVLSLKNAMNNGVDLGELQGEIDGALAVGKTVAIVLLDGIAKGAIAFQDTIRENAKAVMSEMKESGYHTIMLTGDNGRSANFIASQCNIAEVKYDLLPENKLTAIEDLQSEKHKVVMVGDGINDAPSLKIADCSFAMGAMGSDIAIDSADMAILNSDIQKVADTMRLSKRVMRTIKRNIAIAMSISAVGVILSALGFLTPVTGALVHNCTSVLVVASSALVLYSRKRKSKDNIAKID